MQRSFSRGERHLACSGNSDGDENAAHADPKEQRSISTPNITVTEVRDFRDSDSTMEVTRIHQIAIRFVLPPLLLSALSVYARAPEDLVRDSSRMP